MKRYYDLEREGMRFKADFNHRYERLRKVLEVRLQQAYYKVDVVRCVSTGSVCLSRRSADFSSKQAVFDVACG